jgi:Cu(I)/Ag(I) efflux system membrane protein CusA/SilA
VVERTIAWCIAHRLVVLLGCIGVAGWGLWAMLRTPIDALPDISDVQVIVATEWPGRSPELVEAQVTYPIVTALVSAPRVRSVRAVTDFGASFVYIIFDDSVGIYWARDRVLERLQDVRSALPESVTPKMSADATAAGWVFEYGLVDETGRHTSDELRSLQDWKIRSALASVPGVAEVATIGGFVKQYQINLEPSRLSALNLSPMQIVSAIRANNNDVDGRVLEFAGREYMVRARGYLKSIADIEQIVVRADQSGAPIRVADVAEVRIGPEMRQGLADLDGRGEIVGGIVIMRVGERALDVITAVRERLAEVRRTLPAGIELVTLYDRSQLIGGSFRTLARILVEEAAIVSLVVIVFLSSARAAIIPIIMLPVAALASFIPLAHLGVTANIMSLGGIALAIGVLVDAAIVMVENAHRRLHEPGDRSDDPPTIVERAARQIGRPVFYSLAIIVASFVPVFLLEAQEGRMFRSLALTKTASVGASTLLAVTLVPVLMSLLLRRAPAGSHPHNAVMRFCSSIYEPLLRWALQRRWTVVVLNSSLIPIAAVLFVGMGHEFMPPLFEGHLLYMPSSPPGVSVTESARTLQTQDQVLRSFPEVERVFGTAGRATTATDNSPLGMVNTIVTLRPQKDWRPGITFEGLQAQMDLALKVPGLSNVWTQPIRGRVDMLSTGIKTPLGIKVLGSELETTQRIGAEIEGILRTMPETQSAYAERPSSGYFTDIDFNREAVGRHGLTVQEVEDVVEIAIGGRSVGHVLEGRERYPIAVRYQADFRSDSADFERVLVKTPAGAQIPLGQLARVATTPGPATIRSEGGLLAEYVYVDIAGRDIGGYVARARQLIDERISLPPGYRLEWSGQYESQVRASRRLRVVLPLVVVTIFVLLYFTFASAGEAAIVMLSVVYSLTGGVFLQWWLGYPFSVAVWVGYIALFGIAVQAGVIMIVYLQEALRARMRSGRPLTEDELYQATLEGALLRLRPKAMTIAATILGLLPILWSDGIGADLLKPIAAPIMGGMITSAVHVLIITPVVFYLAKRRELRRTLQAACSIP